MSRKVGYYQLVFVLFVAACSGQKGSARLPEKWTSEFSISLYTGGGMKDESFEANFTHDSARFVNRTGTNQEVKSFALTENMRSSILKKLHELKIDEIKEKPRGSDNIVLDEESSRLCLNSTEEFCVTDGGAGEISGDDQDRFFKAYAYLATLSGN